jgi:copper transport protein
MRRLGVVVAAAALMLPGGWLLGSSVPGLGLVPAAAAHSELLSSTPGSGEVLADSPNRVVLVFSEPIDPAHTSLDLLDSNGATIATGLGDHDPTSDKRLIATLPALAQGTYTVNWRALSAADGHSTSGSLSFGVGNVAAGSLPLDVGGSGGDLHAGHDAGQILLEVQGRTLSDLGFMLAFGLLVVMLAVVRPAGLVVRGLLQAQLGGLLVGGVSGIVLGFSAGSAPGLDPIGYLLGSASGGLLVDRFVLAVAIVVGAALLARLGRRTAAEVLAGIGGAAGLGLIALSGHPSAAGIGPLANVAVHVGAAAVWVAGVAALAGLAIARPDSMRAWLPAFVPRFSALAVVSVALAASTGLYLAWLETGDLTTVDSQYAVALIVKAALVGAALVLGAFNLFGRGRVDARLGGFGRRIVVEGVILAGVVVATANMASGSPPGPERPVPLAASRLAGSVAASGGIDPSLAVEPGRPGPNAWWVRLPTSQASPSVDAIEIRFQRLDQTGGDTIVPLRAVPNKPGTWVATGGVLPADSRWSATVVASAGSTETGRSTFDFAVGDTTITEGRATLPIDPALALALVLFVGSVVGLAFAAAGGVLPLVEPRAGRRALLGGGLVGAVLALALALGSLGR